MQYRKLGSSALDVSVVGFGAWPLGDPGYWGDEGHVDGAGAVAAALDAGITFFDVAESYGNGESERVLGKALGSRRGEVIIASKVSAEHCGAEELRAACEGSLARLGTDYLDLYQVHWPSRVVPFDETYGALAKLREEGKIRAIGVSNFGVRDLGAWLKAGECVSNQVGYNALFRAVEFAILPACVHAGVGVVAYMPLMQGILSGRWGTVDVIPASRRRTRHFSCVRSGTRHGEAGCEAQMFETLGDLRVVAAQEDMSMADLAAGWLIAQQGVASILVGGRNPKQVLRNAGAAEVRMSKDLVARVNAITQPVKDCLGMNADMWCGEMDSRIK